MISASKCQTPYKKLTRIVKGPIVFPLLLSIAYEKFDTQTGNPGWI